MFIYYIIVYLCFNRIRILSPPTTEKFKVNFEQYLSESSEIKKENEEKDEIEKSDVVIASH